ncbi:hypothetical protein THAOC_19522 [Thalassiosira oceanica]|uniref:Uncharacterized protein n=1 Tax=Thalassiosira oceanica TaxID=159749 RepID=K0SP27_THAOC|nr:hypothetical protein THAOC_19522 [Thalassiosira oceanica]|eukprot:EJK60172.1 hypothetical protein THAOC_19522 [Thalassiosira oceanica]
MNELRKRARTGNDKVAGAPAAAEPPALPKLAGDATAATKIAELQAELEAIKQSHEAVVDKLNAKVDALQAKNESQLREIKDLTSALQWAYAVEEIPRQHWLEQGHSEEYADAMENLLNSMKQNIETLRVGGNCETITIDFDLQDEDENYFPLDDMKRSIKDLRMGTVSDNGPGVNIIKIDFDLLGEDENYIRAGHDELLMPYWKEFAAALRHWSEYLANGKWLEVEIIYIELPRAALDTLRPAFEQSRIENVYFDNCRHSGDVAGFVKKVLQANHSIRKVGFGQFIFTQEDVDTICGAIKSRNARGHFIKRLAMRDCFEGGIDTCTLKIILMSISSGSAKKVTLDLSDNEMSSREAAVIASFLNSNPSFTLLELDGNEFNDADAVLLANALTSNTHLWTIEVGRNSEIKENGRLAFLRAIFDITSLSSCASSNHTCRVEGLERDISVLNSYKSVPRNKWRKIFAMLALSSEDSFINTSLLRGVPAQLIPMILGNCNHGLSNSSKDLTDLYLELTNTTRCQKHDVWDSLKETKSLNCMYNLMRSWPPRPRRRVSSERSHKRHPPDPMASRTRRSPAQMLSSVVRPDVVASASRGRNRPDHASSASLSSLPDSASTKARGATQVGEITITAWAPLILHRPLGLDTSRCCRCDLPSAARRKATGGRSTSRPLAGSGGTPSSRDSPHSPPQPTAH